MDNDYARRRPIIPTWLQIAAVLIAVLSFSALLKVLFDRTEGPGPVLHAFAERIRDQDCPGSYELLDDTVKGQIEPKAWCAMLGPVADRLNPRFTVREMLLRGPVAELTIRGRLSADVEVWRLRRAGKTWRVLGPACGFSVPAG